MTKLRVTETFGLSPQAAWDRASDLHRFDQWLTIHDGWRSELPDEIEQGLRLTSVISVRGMRNRIDWTLDQYEPIEKIGLSGEGKSGTSVSMTLTITPHGDGTAITMHVDFSNPMARGPIASAIGRSLKGDITKSMAKLAALPD